MFLIKSKSHILITLSVILILATGCSNLLFSNEENLTESKVAARTNTDKGIGYTQKYFIGELLQGKHSKSGKDDIYYIEQMTFTGFVGDSFSITYNIGQAAQTLYYPLQENYITTPLQINGNTQHFTSQFEVIGFDIEKGSIDLKRVQ